MVAGVRLRNVVTVVDALGGFVATIAALVGLAWAFTPSGFNDPAEQIAGVLAPGLVAVVFAVAAVFYGRRFVGRSLHAVAAVAVVLWIATVPPWPFALDLASTLAANRFSLPDRGIRFDGDLRLSGALNGHLEKLMFGSRAQHCEPVARSSPEFEINGIWARLDRDLVVFTVDLLQYDGPGVYPVGIAANRDHRVATLYLSHSIGPVGDNVSEEWISTDGTVMLNSDLLSGRFDVIFTPRPTSHAPAGPIRLVGEWRCSAPSAIVD